MKFIALLSLLVTFPSAMRAEEADKLDVPGLFPIESPIKGYRWKKMDLRDGVFSKKIKILAE